MSIKQMGPTVRFAKHPGCRETPIICRVPVGRMNLRTHKVKTKGRRLKVKYVGIR